MARGKHFNHKEKGHEPTISKQGQEVEAKANKHIEYAINTVATEDAAPVSFKIEK
jgi:hypothetical protein